MGWKADKQKTVTQLAEVWDGRCLDTAYWEGRLYQQIKNALTGLGNRIPVDQDFTDIAAARLDSDVVAARVLLITKLHDLGAAWILPAQQFSVIGIGFNSGFKSEASSSYANNATLLGTGHFWHGLRFTGGAGATGNAITMAGSSFGVVSGCWFDNLGGYAIQETGVANDNLIQNCNMSNTITNNPAFLLLGANSFLSNCIHTPYD